MHVEPRLISSLTHQIDNYNSFVTVLGTAYYTARIDTHVGQVQQKLIHACCNADECIRIKALLYGGPTVSCQLTMAQ